MKTKSDWKAAAIAKLALDVTLVCGLGIFFGVMLATGIGVAA